MAAVVQAEGIRRTFGATVALDSVDLEVPQGTVVALLGPNGAGKTTFVRILATLLLPDSGRAQVFGHDVVTQAPAVRRRIALTGQFAAVDELLTGRENLRMFARLFHLDRMQASARADALLGRFGLTDAGDRPVRTYSGGMRRRLDLASSLVTQAQLLFLDEPTTGLDPRSRRQMWQVIRDLVGDGVTLLLTTQNLEEADELADRIVVMDRGRIIAEGTGDELKDHVGGQVVLVRLQHPSDRDRAVRALAPVGCEPRHERRADVLVLPVHHDGVGLVADVARALHDADIAVLDLALRRPTLDDVFLELTGRRAVEEPTAA
ncbi:MAG: ATP-binding cassette domain-containing protein [Actinomycetota bacterium]|nr:ATP-binding cassette domain-containing protein [Actinomycetota bacterium]